MATHKGQEGIVKTGANAIAEIRSYTIEETADTLDDTTMGDTARTRLSSLTSFSGSLDVLWDETDTNGQESLTIGSTATINVYPEGDTSGDVELTGSIIVTGRSINAAHDGLVEMSITFEGSGALTKGTVV